jgi:two-component system NtrC family sensor kinase
MVGPSINQCGIESSFSGTDQDWLAIIGSLSDSVTLVDRMGVVLFTNHQSSSARAEISVGDSVYSQFQLPDQKAVRRHVADVFGTGIPAGFEMRDAAGGPGWYRFLVKSFRNAQQITRVVVIKTDVTEQKMAQESRVNNEIQMLETQRLAAIAQLAAGVGHEINNPLSVIQGYTEVLLNGDQSEDVYFQLNNVLVASQRINKIVKELNRLARYTQPIKTPVSMNIIVDQVVLLKRPDFERSKIRIIDRVSNALLHVTANPYQLVQAIVNILTNAQQSIASVDRAGEIVITSSQDHAYSKVHFSDNGSGIDPANIDKVFDPFFTTHEINDSAGLGLSVSYSIARQNSGRLWVESVLGQGATFHLELPIRKGSSQEIPE